MCFYLLINNKEFIIILIIIIITIIITFIIFIRVSQELLIASDPQGMYLGNRY